MTGPFADWPHLRGAPTEHDVDLVRELYRREAARPTLAAMHVELRHLFEDQWRLELVGERDGQPVTYFSEDIEAGRDGEREAAAMRLVRAGRMETWIWSPADGGWDGKSS